MSAATPAPTQRTALHIIALIVGGLLGFIAVVLMIAGFLLGFLYAIERDNDGFYTSSTERLVTTTNALTTEEIDLGSGVEPDSPLWDLDLATVRVTARSKTAPVFIGIAREELVEAYLDQVRHEEIESVEFDPFSYETTLQPGTRRPAPPVEQSFWAASASGAGEQSLEWDVQQGRWAVVLMNADGSPGVDHAIRVGAKVDLIGPIAAIVLGLAALAMIVSLVLMVVGIRGLNRRPDHAPAVATGPATAGPYPSRLVGSLDDDLSPALWLVKWFLAIPHFLILIFLWIAFWIVTVVAFFSILFTARYPRGLFDFNVGVMRWTWRVAFYATSAIGTDRYPPFTLESVDYPADFTVEYPERLSRGLVLVKWWLLAIPHYLIVAVFGGGLQWPAVAAFGSTPESPFGPAWGGPGSLVFILVIIAGAALLFTRRYPRGIFEFVMGLNRWVFRVQAYVALMTDVYPPFRLDMGSQEPERSSLSQRDAS